MSQPHPTTKQAITYLRVATAAQSAHDQLTRQRQACDAIAQRLGVEIVEEYADIGSTRRTERPGIRRLLRRCASGDIHYAIASDEARFSRNRHDIAKLHDTLRQGGTRIVTNPSALADKLYSTIAGVMAELDHKERSERAKAGWVKHRTARRRAANRGERSA